MQDETPDLRRILQSWPYDPEEDARIIQGEDGRSILQVRTPVGIEQYEMDGRPDGMSPHGAESALEHHLTRLTAAKEAGTENEFSLSPEECSELFNESTLYYFRYIRLFQLRDWHRTIRDTARNLKAFNLINRYAEREEDQTFLEKWRPYVLRVHATATAMRALDDKKHEEALKAVKGAIHTIETMEEIEDETYRFERDRSLVALREMAGQIERERPLSRIEQLERQLHRAIERQEFEKAAELRDKIRVAKAGAV